MRLFQDLLPDQVRVLGPDHPGTLATRSDIAYSAEVLSAEDPENTATT